MHLAQDRHQPLVVVAQLGQHVLRIDVVGVVVGQALVARDISDRMQGQPADLAGALGDRVGHGEDLFALLVQEQVVVTEVVPAHMPVEILGLEIERENVCEQAPKRGRDVARRIGLEVGGGCQSCTAGLFGRIGTFAHRYQSS